MDNFLRRLFALLGIVDAGSPTNGGVLVKSGSKLTTTTAGTAGQVLTSNGAGNVPTYQAAAAGSTWASRFLLMGG